MTKFRPVKLITFFMLFILTISCSENYDASHSKLLKSEFEKTYQYTIEHMSVDTQQSYPIEELREINSAALISIAYLWHSHASNLCSNNAEQETSRKLSSYDKLIDKQSSPNISFSKTPDSLQNCHSLVFFDNWSEIQKMISLNIKQ